MSCTACPDVPFFTSVTVLRTISQVCPPFHSQSVWLKWDPNAYISTREPKCHNWRSPCTAVQMQHSQKVKIKKTCKHRVRHVSQDKVRPERTSKAVMETLFGERVFLSPSQKWAHAQVCSEHCMPWQETLAQQCHLTSAGVLLMRCNVTTIRGILPETKTSTRREGERTYGR